MTEVALGLTKTAEVSPEPNDLWQEFEVAPKLPDNTRLRIFTLSPDEYGRLQPKMENTVLFLLRQNPWYDKAGQKTSKFFLVRVEPFVTREKTTSFVLDGIEVKGVGVAESAAEQINLVGKAVEQGKVSRLPEETFEMAPNNRIGTVTFIQEGISGYATKVINGEVRLSRGLGEIPQFFFDAPKVDSPFEGLSRSEVLSIGYFKKR